MSSASARRAHPKLVAYPALAGAAFLTAVVSGRPELVVLGLPFAAVVVFGLATTGPLDADVDVSVAPAVAFDGDEVELTVTIHSAGGVPWVHVHTPADDRLAVVGPSMPSVRLPPGSTASEVVHLACRRWGAYRVGRLQVDLADRFHLFHRTIDVRAPAVLRVHPTPEHLRSLVTPRRVNALTGAHRSARRGEGIEFAETRPFVPGDRLRAVNWRATARLGGWWVSDRHPERTGDLVLFVDSFAEAGTGPDTTLAVGVRAAMALSRSHLGVHDRVGMVGLGGVLHWVTTGAGRLQLHRVVEALLDTEVIASEAEKGVDVVPVRALPPRATVVAFTPLLDPRSLRFLLELRGRGYDVAVVECSPEAVAEPGPDRTAAAAWRWWCLERAEQRASLVAAGVAVAAVGPRDPFDGVVAQLVSSRRRPVRVAVGRRM